MQLLLITALSRPHAKFARREISVAIIAACVQAFKEVKLLLAKSSGKLVKDVMTKNPITCKPNTGINEATG